MRLFSAFLFLTMALRAGVVYNVVGLGSFGGDDSAAYGIAASGRTAGTAVNAQGQNVAIAGGTGTGNATVLATDAQARAVNSSGQVVGTANGRATVWQNNIATEILSGDSFGLGINDSGDVAGAHVVNGTLRAFTTANGAVHDLPVGGLWSAAYDINSSGSATGYMMLGNGNFRAFRWTADEGTQMLGTLGGKSSYAQALNDSGVVVGSSTTNDGWLHAFAVFGNRMSDLGTLGGSLSAAYDINLRSQVVGYSYDALGRSRAFLWSDGLMIDLNTLLPGGSGWTLDAAYGINDGGQIVGRGTYGGQVTAFRLDPLANFEFSSAPAMLSFDAPESAAVPEPGVLGMTAVGLLLLAVRRVRQQSPGDRD